MRRRWWHVAIIATSLVAIAVIGVVAIWGPSIRELLDSSAGSDHTVETDTPPPATGGGGVL